MTGDRVCVHGLGYVGLPTAAVLAASDYDVYGYDVDDDLVADLQAGRIECEEPGLDSLVREALAAGTLAPVDEPVRADYHLVCVPTALTDDRTADLSAVEAAAGSIAPTLRSGDVVVLESTVPPGTTTGVLAPILAEEGSVDDGGFGLVYSPETVLPGRILAELRSNDRIVGGVDRASTATGVELYDSFVEGDLHETDATTAEFAKLAQNTYRDANVALANEFARLARDHGVDPREVVALGNSHPRVDVHDPGPGPGGHCLPVDPWFLCEDTDRETLIERARRLNDDMVTYVADLVAGHFEDLSTRRIAVLGTAYKGGVADTRRSPGLRLASELRNRRGAAVRLHDVHADDYDLAATTLSDVTAEADAVVVTTGHEEYGRLDRDRLREQMRTPVAVDTTDVLDADAWRAAGFEVTRL